MPSIWNYKMAKFWLVVLVGVSCLRNALAAEEATFCAFEVRVSTPSGAPFPNVPVALIRGHTSTFSEATTDAGGVARLCDSPLDVVDIVVGFDMCGSVLVRNLHPMWPESRKVYVTYVNAPCEHFGAAPTCRILMRTQDEEGRPMSGARFEGKPSGQPGQDVSDVFGRLFRSVRRRETLAGVVAKEGREPVQISQPCLDDLELKVVLRKR
jgi:hypothetical protein